MAANSPTGKTRATMPGYIPRTAFAAAYVSNHTQMLLTRKEVTLLRHVNCGYLSTEGTPPTLLALKQHAQALAGLIQKLCITTTIGSIDGHARQEPAFERDEAFDWLNDLSTPYQNDDEWHHAPLTSLTNLVEAESELDGVVLHCPLERHRMGDHSDSEDDEGHDGRPFATQHNLAMHANECLEILDHEYGAEGGLLGIMRLNDADHAAMARKTVLGALLLHSQNMALRMHDLELNYANCLDVLADEAAVPMQLLGPSNVDALSGGRPIAYPQDRWIMVHAEAETHAHVHRLLSREEQLIEQQEQQWTQEGTMGERMRLEGSDGTPVARGLVMVDVMTRYYRVREQGPDAAIFVMPASTTLPTLSRLYEMEKQATVVAVPEPQWPVRVSVWEENFRAGVKEAERMGASLQKMQRSMGVHAQRFQNLTTELGRLNRLVEVYEARDGADATAHIRDLQAKLDSALAETVKMRAVLPKWVNGRGGRAEVVL